MSEMASRQRHDWIDIAKAFSILLVVFNHEVVLLQVIYGGLGPDALNFWTGASNFVGPLRMPLFFLASGLLAARSLDASDAAALRKRVYTPLYIYVVWAGLLAIAVPTWPPPAPADHSLAVVILRIGMGISLAWYLWALAIAFLIGWVTRRQHPLLVLALACALWLLPIEFYGPNNLWRCLPYYLVGLRFAQLVTLATQRARPWLLVASLGVFLALSMLPPEALVWLRPLLETSGMTCTVCGCVLLARLAPRIALGGRWLGQRTLPVYVLHFPLLALFEYGLASLSLRQGPQWNGVMTLWPVVTTMLVTAACCGVHRLLDRGPGRWLFALPPAWSIHGLRGKAAAR